MRSCSARSAHLCSRRRWTAGGSYGTPLWWTSGCLPSTPSKPSERDRQTRACPCVCTLYGSAVPRVLAGLSLPPSRAPAPSLPSLLCLPLPPSLSLVLPLCLACWSSLCTVQGVVPSRSATHAPTAPWPTQPTVDISHLTRGNTEQESGVSETPARHRPHCRSTARIRNMYDRSTYRYTRACNQNAEWA